MIDGLERVTAIVTARRSRLLIIRPGMRRQAGMIGRLERVTATPTARRSRVVIIGRVRVDGRQPWLSSNPRERTIIVGVSLM